MKLSATEINLTLKKIKNKYESIVRDFNKSRALVEAFDDRYMQTLRGKMDLSTFLMGEIDAVEEIYNKAALKHEMAKSKNAKPTKTVVEDSFADKVMDDNLKKLLKYTRIEISNDTTEEVERLMGALRDLLINYWPAVDFIFKSNMYSADKRVFSDIYQKLLGNYDTRGEIPITKHYIEALNQKPMDSKRINYEYNFLLKESAFLLNDIIDKLDEVLTNSKVPNSDKVLDISSIASSSHDTWFYEYFNHLTHRQSVEKVSNFVKQIVSDFRIQSFKRSTL